MNLGDEETTIDLPLQIEDGLEESESTNEGDRKKKEGKKKLEDEPSQKKRRKRSSVWDHFTELPIGDDGIERCTCNYCGRPYHCKSKHGTGNMKRHLGMCVRTKTKDISQALIDARDGSLKNPKISQDKFRELLIFSIIKHDMPFSFVEYEGIRDIFQYLNPDVKHITRNTAKMDVLKIHTIEAKKVKVMLVECPGRICLTSDLWTSIATDGYMSLTAHFLDKDWVLQKRLINFSYMPPPHSGIALADKIFKLLCSWGIEKKIFSITLDNASSNDVASNMLKSQLTLRDGLLCEGEFFHIRCCAHILNLIVQDGLKTLDESIEKIRECVKYVKGSQARKMKFIECVSQSNLNSKKTLRQDVPTRWNSTYLMLENAVYYHRAFLHLEMVDSNFKHCPEPNEWEKVKKICLFLKVFYTATCTFSGNKYPTANLYFPQVLLVQHTLKKEMTNGDSFLCNMACQMHQKFDKYWAKYSLILGIAVVLDPRYKFQLIEFSYKKLYGDKSREWSIECGIVKDKLFKLYDAYVSKSNKTTSSSGEGTFLSNDTCCGKETSDFLMEFETFESEEFMTSEQKSQLELYLDEPRTDRHAKSEQDVLMYWKAHQYRYPDLSKMARDILAIPITTVASESAFSIGGRVLDQYRSSLKSDVVEALLCTRDWIFRNGGNMLSF